MDKKKIGAILAIVAALFIGIGTFTKGIITFSESKGKMSMSMGAGFMGSKICFMGKCKSMGIGKTYKKGSTKGSAYGAIIFGIISLIAGLGMGVLTFIDKDGSKAPLIQKASLATLGCGAIYLLLTIVFLFTIKGDMEKASLGYGFYLSLLGGAAAIAHFFVLKKADE